MPPPTSHPLRIIHANSLLTGGGADDTCVKLAAALRGAGHHASLAGTEGREFARVAQAEGLPLHGLEPRGAFHARFILQLARLLRRERADVLHAHHGRDYWPSVVAARLSGVRPRLVLTRHLAKSPGSWASRTCLLNRCHAMVAVSQFVARVLVEGVYEPDSPEPERRSRPPVRGDVRRVQVIYSGFNTDRFQPGENEAMRRTWGLRPGEFAFGVVGGYALPRGKGQREFLQAAAQIKDRVPKARFLIVGRGNMQAVIEADIARLGLAGVARLTPWCEDMPAAMNALDCLVLPQVGTEALPGVVIEAHACGRPVIASAMDGIPEAFAAGALGQLIRPEAVDELAEAMVSWAARAPAPHAERLAMHRRVETRFCLRAATQRYSRFYAWLMQPERERPPAPDWNASSTSAGMDL